MFDASAAATAALSHAVDAVASASLDARLSALVSEVWRANLGRHEPDELGDDAQTLGTTCARNIINRVERLVNGSSEHEQEVWDIVGLRVARPYGALRLDYAQRHFYVMNSP
ncbi:MAG: hypothetical protein WCA30_09060, partial [Dermatophilaceae bacterium]